MVRVPFFATLEHCPDIPIFLAVVGCKVSLTVVQEEISLLVGQEDNSLLVGQEEISLLVWYDDIPSLVAGLSKASMAGCWKVGFTSGTEVIVGTTDVKDEGIRG